MSPGWGRGPAAMLAGTELHPLHPCYGLHVPSVWSNIYQHVLALSDSKNVLNAIIYERAILLVWIASLHHKMHLIVRLVLVCTFMWLVERQREMMKCEWFLRRSFLAYCKWSLDKRLHVTQNKSVMIWWGVIVYYIAHLFPLSVSQVKMM